jgi:hypothetical protein
MRFAELDMEPLMVLNNSENTRYNEVICCMLFTWARVKQSFEKLTKNIKGLLRKIQHVIQTVITLLRIFGLKVVMWFKTPGLLA